MSANSLPNNCIITMKRQSGLCIAVSTDGAVCCFGQAYPSEYELWAHIAVEQSPTFPEAVLFKSVHGKYMVIVKDGDYLLPMFVEPNAMAAVPIVSIIHEGNHISFIAKTPTGEEAPIVWFRDSTEKEIFFYEYFKKEICTAFINCGSGGFVTYSPLSSSSPSSFTISCTGQALSYKSAFVIEMLSKWKVLIRLYSGWYLGMNPVDGSIRVVSSDNPENEPALSFYYVMLDNNLVAFKANNSKFVSFNRVDKSLKASAQSIGDSEIFKIVTFMTKKKEALTVIQRR